MDDLEKRQAKRREIINDMNLEYRELLQLRKEVEKLKKIIEIQKHTIERWCPCSGHRDKIPPKYCPVCVNERQETYIRKLTEALKPFADFYKNEDHAIETTEEVFVAAFRDLNSGEHLAEIWLSDIKKAYGTIQFIKRERER